LHDAPDGNGKIFATERELHYLDADGRVRIKGPNGGLAGGGLRFAVPATGDRPSLATKDEDDALLETYIAHKGLKPSRAKEARDLFHLFKTTVGKPLAKCDRSDGRKVVATLGDVKSATLRRKMVPLVAMANFGISEGRLTFNPFAGCVADRDDSERRLPFDDADMALIRANLLKLGVQDQLLVRTLATTGMRLSEAFEIDREQTEGGCRFVIVGTKTDQSLRRVPLPTALMKHLPKPVKGKLFAGLPNAASTRLGKWLRDECGITDTAKVAAHSYRHRAKDRLRMKHPRVGRCPEDVAEEIFGRDKKTIAAGYGKGSPVPDLKEWIDRIGF
jgi:integrase